MSTRKTRDIVLPKYDTCLHFHRMENIETNVWHIVSYCTVNERPPVMLNEVKHLLWNSPKTKPKSSR